MFGKTNVYTDGEGKIHEIDEIIPKAREAVRKRFIMEQAARTKEVIEDLCILKHVDQLPDDCYSVLAAADYIDGGHDKRVQNAKWHISYFSDKDREQIEKVMNRAGCADYKLYQSIDERPQWGQAPMWSKLRMMHSFVIIRLIKSKMQVLMIH